MDEKKVREAIEDLKGIAFKCEGVLESLPSKEIERSAYKNIPQSIYTAIEALEKQLPKKVEMLTEYRDLNGNLMCFKAFCPSCGRVVESYRNKNCHVCTQVLDWSE